MAGMQQKTKKSRRRLPARSQRILVLMHDTLIPPDDAASVSQAVLDECRTEFDVVQQLKALQHEVRCLGLGDNLQELINTVQAFKPHVVFNLAEEFQGIVSHDQHVVSLLELLRQPYTGCNPRGLTLSRDKALAKRMLMAHGIATPPFLVLEKHQRVPAHHGLRFPLFVKSVTDDASYGIAKASLVHDNAALKQRVAFIHEQIGSAALVEEFITGRELYVGVIGNDKPECYPVWELDFGSAHQPQARIATRKVKWDRRYRQLHGIGSHRAVLPKRITQQLEQQALAAYRALSLSGYARMDFRLGEDRKPYLLEANANPCLTASEDFARAAAAAGDDYGALLTRIIKLGRSHRAAWRQ